MILLNFTVCMYNVSSGTGMGLDKQELEWNGANVAKASRHAEYTCSKRGVTNQSSPSCEWPQASTTLYKPMQ